MNLIAEDKLRETRDDGSHYVFRLLHVLSLVELNFKMVFWSNGNL